MKNLKVRITLLDEILGMSPSSKEIYADFIGSNAPDAPSLREEIEAIGINEVVEKGMTVFPRDDEGNPIMWDYNVDRISSSIVASELDKYGIYVRGGLHCAPSIHRKLGTLGQGAVRLSFSYLNKINEIDFLYKAIKEILFTI